MKFPRKIKQMHNGCIAYYSSGIKKPAKLIDEECGKLNFNNELWMANRLSFHLNNKKITRTLKNKEELVLHTCDNGWCINPDHLYLGSDRQNKLDMFNRNKTIKINMSKSRKGRKPFLGFKHTKLTKDKMIASHQKRKTA